LSDAVDNDQPHRGAGIGDDFAVELEPVAQVGAEVAARVDGARVDRVVADERDLRSQRKNVGVLRARQAARDGERRRR
jgi:hypothetical protein